MKKRLVYEWCRVCRHNSQLTEEDVVTCNSCEYSYYEVPTNYNPLDVIKEFIVLNGGSNDKN